MSHPFLELSLFTTRLFFRSIGVSGREHIPADAPILVVANHPNALIDGIIVRIALGRDVGFLAKSTLFQNPFGKLWMEGVAGVPVYRVKDGEDTSKNDLTYQMIAERFSQNRSIVIFPEGVSHDEPQLRKLKTGAARFALRYVLTHEGPLYVLPMGMFYEDKATFRSRVSVAIGPAIDARDWIERAKEAEFEAALDLTKRITDALSELVLEADNTQMWQMFAAVARWTEPKAREDVTVAQDKAQELAEGYRRLRLELPGRAEEIQEAVLRFERELNAVGIDNPWDVEDVFPNPSKIAWMVVTTVLIFVPALIGTIASFVPYQAIGPLARKISGTNQDMISTVKAIGGLVFMPWVFALEALAIGLLWRWEAGLVALVTLPLCGLAALRFWEAIEIRRRALKASWLRISRKDVAEAIQARRKELSADIERAYDELSSLPG